MTARTIHAALAALIVGCSGSGGGQTPPNTASDFPTSRAEASRFLGRATFGATAQSIDHLTKVGYGVWLDQQIAMPATLRGQQMLASGVCLQEFQPSRDCTEAEFDRALRMRDSLWWKNAIEAPDQLRQRVAFALSQIFVVSKLPDEISDLHFSFADYGDVLARHAFGSYRDLIRDVTLHPVMGMYLSLVKNSKPDPLNNTRPDENYARELMQLFSVGLVMLNQDGTPKRDAAGLEIPTYDQSVIVGMAHALTGWNFKNAPTYALEEWLDADPFPGPMEPADAFHDMGTKRTLGNQMLPAGRSTRADLAAVLDAVALHPNVGPFLGKQLIQQLVTSNPSPAYVARIAGIWEDDGNGKRGNLGAVVRAILTDKEAMAGATGTAKDRFGRIREPVLRVTALWRGFGATIDPNTFDFLEIGELIGQDPFGAASVFNFYRPDYTSRALRGLGLVAPELEITTHTYVARVPNLMAWMIYDGHDQPGEPDYPGPRLRMGPAVAMARDTAAWVNHLDELLMGGTMSTPLRQTLADHAAAIDANESLDRVLDTLQILMHAPEFAVQK